MTELKTPPFVKEKVKIEKCVNDQICAQRRSLSLRGFLMLKSKQVTDDSISALGTQKELKVIKFSKNTNITSLEQMPPQPNLVEIIANSTQLYSYKGLSKFKNVTMISINDTPMSKRPNYRLALLLAFGPRIQIINGEKISNKERMRAINYASICKEFIDNDWDPSDEAPTEKEIIQLMKKYKPDDAKRVIKQGKITESKRDDILSPAKTYSLMKTIKTQKYVYDKTENDGALIDALIEKFAAFGIFINKDENCQENLLKVIQQFADITKNLCDLVVTDDTYQEEIDRISQQIDEENTEIQALNDE